MKISAAFLFEWPSRHNIHIALPLFLILSFLVHAGAMLVLQASYPHTRAMPPRSTQVYFLRPGSPEAARIAPMLAASDPALFSPAQTLEEWPSTDAGYVTSFDSQKPSLAPMPSLATGPRIREMKILPRSFSAQKPTPLKRTAGLPTQVQLGGELTGRELTPPTGTPFSANPPHIGLAPVEFLVSVSPAGLPTHLFQQSSSGDESLDRAALAYLARCHFSQVSGEEATWGTATFLWGSDVERKKEP